MSFLIVNVLSPDCTEAKRLSVRDDHLAYSQSQQELIRLSSRMHSPDGKILLGGFFLLRTDDPEQAQKFYDNDPYVLHDVWRSVVFSSVQLPAESEA